MLAEDSSGPAADTGTAVHAAAEHWHKNTREFAAALKAMKDNLPRYPLADLGAAEQQFRHYCNDPRNQSANVILCEAKIQVILEAPEGDTSPVVINGTLDQVRQEGSALTVVDIKTGGSMEGQEMLDSHAAQLAAYMVGAAKLLGRPVYQAAILRTKDYLKTDRSKKPKPGPVFWYASWGRKEADRMLEEVRRIIGRIRRGEVSFAPSAENCRYCPGGGVANCLGRMVS